MGKLKVLTIFGTRPEGIKMAPLIQKMNEHDSFECVVAVTAQHRQMLDQVLEKFSISPDFDLNIMKDRQTIGEITTRVILSIGEVIKKSSPHIVLVHGDTTTTFAAALTAFYENVKVGHVEAGLRSFDKCQPYPEEMNRKLTSSLADLHFAPTCLSKQNLLNENISHNSIYVTGNTVIDAMRKTVSDSYEFSEKALRSVDYGKKIITMTAHRRENIGKPLEQICRAVLEITKRHKDVVFVYAVHKNPAVRDAVFAILGNNPQVLLTEPLDIDDMHNLIAKSYIVLTDSGGLQEEAPALSKPVVVLRNVTERPEGIDAGALILAGVEKDAIVKEVCSLLDDEDKYNKMALAKNPYGDGMASERITDALLYAFGKSAQKPCDYTW